MARSGSSLAPLLVAVAGLALVLQSLTTFVPAPVHRSAAAVTASDASYAAYAAAIGAVAATPAQVLAFGEDEDDGFDVRFLVVLALPLGAATWALFNVWRVAFRQVSRFSTSNMGSEQGVSPGD
mmetsp:Transcript_55682/g.125243  ORF Transcript_55682/g.125243 Transcript_55682/m.125243 type:complete len:124 (+) Transcript_55682:44-415(+)